LWQRWPHGERCHSRKRRSTDLGAR
jgi:hypothetical protein